MSKGYGKKFLNIIGFSNEDMDDEYYEGYYDETDDLPSAQVEPARERRSSFLRSGGGIPALSGQTSTGLKEDDMRIILLQPIRFEEAESIAKSLLNNKVVVFDLHNCDVDEAMDIVNFVSGAIFALGGSIQKMNDTGAIFIAVPPSVSLENELRGGFDNDDYGPVIADWVNRQHNLGDF